MERRVRKLADPIGAKLITPCDVQNDDDVARVFDQAKETYGSARLRAPFDRIRADRRPESARSSTPAARASRRRWTSASTRWRSWPGTRPRACPEGGSIVTLTYFGGERVVPGYNLMGVCKAALDAAVKYLAYDLGPKKIRVNAVSAGPVKTLAASAVGDFDKLAGLYELSSPLGRNITREEVGSAGMFLLSDLASGITGEILHVDCGYNVMGSPGRAIEAAKQLVLEKVKAANPELAAAREATTSSSAYERR